MLLTLMLFELFARLYPELQKITAKFKINNVDFGNFRSLPNRIT